VYQHLPKGYFGPANRVGETKYIDEFTDNEGKMLKKTTIQIGKSFDPIIDRMSKQAANMNLREIAANSRPKGKFDIKEEYKNVGALLNGKYATSRSAGNYLAGYNAAKGRYLGFDISFGTFQKLAGGLHVEGNDYGFFDKVSTAVLGTQHGLPPAYGEVKQQYRQSLEGWEDARKIK
jgi:hypothetical protein